jgi:hypothetical protein
MENTLNGSLALLLPPERRLQTLPTVSAAEVAFNYRKEL